MHLLIAWCLSSSAEKISLENKECRLRQTRLSADSRVGFVIAQRKPKWVNSTVSVLIPTNLILVVATCCLLILLYLLLISDLLVLTLITLGFSILRDPVLPATYDRHTRNEAITIHTHASPIEIPFILLRAFSRDI